MKLRSCWTLAAVLAAVIAIGVAVPTLIWVAKPIAEEELEYESENLSSTVRESVFEADNVTQLTRNKGRNVIVKGKVHSTHVVASGKVLILNLGIDYKSCFKVKVFSSDFAKWSVGPDTLKSMYEGKRIGVAGEITIYDDLPEIKVNGPSQIRTIE